MTPETETLPGAGGAGGTRAVDGTIPIVCQTALPGNAADFLPALYSDLPKDVPWFYLWTLPDMKTRWFTDPDAAGRWIAEHGDGRDVYCGIALADRDGTGSQRVLAEPDPDKPDGILAGGIVAVVADVDIAGPGHTDRKSYPRDLDAALTLMQALPIPPTYTVHSGGGLHLWWILRKPWAFDGAEEREEARELLRGWGATVQAVAKRMGYDLDAVHDLARVLRVPGTTNHKDSENPRPVRILDAASDHRCNPGDFEEYFPEDFAPRAPGVGKIALGDLALPEGAEEELAGRFTAALRQDRRLSNTWARRRTDLKDPSPSGYDLALANRLALKHGWTAAEVAWAVQHSRRAHRGDRRVGPAYVALTVSKALKAAEDRPVRVPIALLGQVPPRALSLWCLLRRAEAAHDQPPRGCLATVLGVTPRQLRRLTRALEQAGALLSSPTGKLVGSAHVCLMLRGPHVLAPNLSPQALSPSALQVLLAVSATIRSRGHQVTQAEIGAWVGVTARTVREHLPELVRGGWLLVEYQGDREPLSYYLRPSTARTEVADAWPNAGVVPVGSAA